MDSRISLHKMSRAERINFIKKELSLSDKEISSLETSKIEILEKLVENVLGGHVLPFGIATNFLINGKDYLVPMVIEESSVIAAASNGAKYAREREGFKANCKDLITVGQIQIVNVKNLNKAKKKILSKKKEIMKMMNELHPSMVERGGGARDVEVEIIKTQRGKNLIAYLFFDCCDAMGANTINTICEKITPFLTDLVGGEYRLRILSNYAVEKLVTATATFKRESVGKEVIEGILDAHALAFADIRRATTNNKGIMNGIDAVAIATGNDWRAIEAGAHAYAARDGKYKPLATWKKDKKGNLVGKIEIPIQVGIVGGIASIHPTAKLALKILGVKSAKELAQVMACVGLANNFAALRALISEGIIKGHMKLHAINLAMAAGATGELADKTAKQMIKENNISMSRAKEILFKMSGKSKYG